MKSVEIARFAYGAHGTFGRLSVRDEEGAELYWCCSLEPPPFPWVQDNARDVACIPVGTYRLEPGTFYANTPSPDDDYPCLVVPDGEVADRGPGLKIHAGNTLPATLGCPLVGERIGFFEGVPAVLSSRKALQKIVDAFGTSTGQLVVMDSR